MLGRAALALVASGLLASGCYVADGLTDRDRRHPTKRSRPARSRPAGMPGWRPVSLERALG